MSASRRHRAATGLLAAAGLLLSLGAAPAGATTYVVDVEFDQPDVDGGDNVCADPNGFCTLRAAINQANAHAGADVITLPAGVYRLSLFGFPGADENLGFEDDLDIHSGPLTIAGAGADVTIVDANGLQNRVFHVLTSGVTLGGITIRGGVGDGGGGLRNAGFALALSDCVVRGNRSTANGGGVLSRGSMTVSRCRIAGNVASGSGSGISSDGVNGDVLIEDSVVAANRGGGGAVASENGATLLARRVEISANTAQGGSGGIDADDATLTVESSTCSGNAGGSGGCAAARVDALLTLRNTTIADNRAVGSGGGLLVLAPAVVELSNTLLADNSAPTGADCHGTVTSADGHNLIETTAGCTITGTTTGNVTGQDPALLPLSNHRGRTRTHAYLAGAPAAQQGDGASCVATDQRGAARGAVCDIGAFELDDVPVPVGLAIDGAGSGLLEIEEDAAIEPVVRQLGGAPVAASSSASDFDGPGAPAFFAYSLPDTSADYGTVAAGGEASCASATGNCFEARIDVASPLRATPHWDATLRETASGAAAQMPVFWRLHVGGSFFDGASSPAYRAIEGLFHHGISGGCGGGRFCPDDLVQRQQLAVLLERAMRSEYFQVPACAGAETFLDVAENSPFCPAVELLESDDVTAGCGDGAFCPHGPVTREQTAKLVLRAKHGAAFTPPDCVGLFSDVALDDPACPWIEQLAAENISNGCAAGRFCPHGPLTRAGLATLLSRAFGLEPWSLGL